MKRVIITAITDEMKEVAELTLPKLQAYAKRCNAELIVLDGLPPHYQHPKYRMFEAAKIEADRYLIIDADIVVRSDASDIFESLQEGNWMLDEGNQRGIAQFEVHKHEVCEYARRGVIFGMAWWNPGVALLDRDAVKAIYTMPPWDVRENLYTCAGGKRIVKNMPWVNYQIARHGIRINQLHVKWNCFVNGSDELEFAHFWHCAGSEISDFHVQNKSIIVKSVCRRFNERLPRKNETPYRLHFVVAQDQHKWILGEMIRQIIARKPKHVIINQAHDNAVDSYGVINYYIPYRSFRKKSSIAVDVAMFTHKEVIPVWEQAKQECDAGIALSKQYYDDIAAMPDAQLIKAGIDDFFYDCRLRVFMPSRMMSYTFNRKGIDTFRRLKQLSWLDVTVTEGSMTAHRLHTEYLMADCVAMLSTMEGLPMACIEALSLGKPYLGRAGVGVHDDIKGVIRYRDDDHLIAILEAMYKVKQRRHNSVAAYRWNHWAEQHWQMFDMLADKYSLEYHQKQSPIPISTGRHVRPVIIRR